MGFDSFLIGRCVKSKYHYLTLFSFSPNDLQSIGKRDFLFLFCYVFFAKEVKKKKGLQFMSE